MTAFLEQAGYVRDARANLWCRPDYSSISYSDGDEVEERLLGILEQASDLSVLSAELRASCTDWPSTYHLSGTRANILRPCENLLKGDILEVGAGCGTVTRYLGESGANVYALEGSFRRATIARTRTRDLSNVTVIAERFDDFRSEQRFDIVTLIGVLEYANLFTGEPEPHRAMLERIRSLLKPGGKITIAIENQLGLKYLAGAPEDHLGQPMYGIEGRYRNDQPQTFGREVLASMLRLSGYLQAQFLAPFPDYKLPAAIVSEAGMRHKDFNAAALAAQTVRRDRQLPPYCNFALELTWPQVFDNGIALDLANSFLIIASPSNAPLDGPDALAYHYSTDRLAPYCKETTFRVSGAGIEVAYKALGRPGQSDIVQQRKVLEFHCSAPVAYSRGDALSVEFLRIVTRDTWSIDEVGTFLNEYVRRLAQLSGRAEASVIGDVEAVLPGTFFDILPQNIIVRADGGADIIDKEWSTSEDVPVQRLLFRALLWMSGSLTAFGHETTEGITTRSALIRQGLSAAGYPLTDERYEALIELECIAQSQVTGASVSGFIRRWIEEPLPRYILNQAMTVCNGELAERDYRIRNLMEAQSAHDAEHILPISERDQQLNERDREIARLVAHELDQGQRIVERDRQGAELSGQTKALDERLRLADAALTEREQTIHALSTTVQELSHAADELQRIRATKMFRLRAALASKGFGPRKVAKIGYLSVALIMPPAVRNSLRPAVARLKRALDKTPTAAKSSTGERIPDRASVDRERQSSATGGQLASVTNKLVPAPPGFDAEFYVRAYPDVRESGVDPVSHYVQHGKSEGRLASLPPADQYLKEPFNADFYLQQYPDVRDSGADPYEHYVLYGKAEGRLATPPSATARSGQGEFVAEFYVRQYPDIREAGVDPYQHYISHGRDEGRMGAPPVVELHVGPKGVVPGRDMVLVVTHEASRSGTPILSLNIIRHLKEFNVVSLLLGDGPLMDAFHAASAVTAGPARVRSNQIAGTYVVDKLLETFQFRFAITNSVESSVVLKGLAQHGVPTVSLIHEFAAYTRPRQIFPEALRWASKSVFSANVTYENAVSHHPDLLDAHYHVLPQGRCEVNADDESAAEPSDCADEEVRRLLRPADASENMVVVLGLGTVQFRKGVDLFLDCAARMLRANPDGDFRFVWFGKGYDPDHDLQYSAYLIEQIRRSGLERHVAIFDETPSIEAVYRLADMLLVTSRLDPLPNVAIDSMTDGLPVLCFERATGIADILVTGGLGDACVSPYLDTETMAAQTLALIRSKSLRALIAEQSRQIALKTFDMPKYVSQLNTLASAAAALVAQQKKDVATMLCSEVVRFDFFDGPSVDNRHTDAKVLEHVRSWATAVNRRKAMPGFGPGVYMEQSPAWREGVDPTASFLREGQPDGPWKYEVITEKTPAFGVPNSTRVALHVHAYYADLLADVMAALNENDIRPDLFISISESTDRALIEGVLDAYMGRVADVSVVPNRGRDIGPFLSQFGETLANGYDIVGHLHTKKTADLETEAIGRNWYRFLLLNLLDGKNRMADRVVARLAADPSLGLVFPDDPHEVGWGKNKAFAEPIAQRLGLGPLPNHFSFPVGTMFWARVDALRPLFELRMTWDQYPSEPLSYDGSMLHALERLLPFIAQKQGYRFAVTNVENVTR
ncbi:MAG: Glycosyl transferase, group 2 family [uncultured Caballeronia sp.]|nr:MAG: Glycosyl transferase, group 2 family [uncultured Caballeronia sp.]